MTPMIWPVTAIETVSSMPLMIRGLGLRRESQKMLQS
jgi:hypothetical protein